MTIDELVNKYYENLNDSDLYIWNYISKNKSKTCNYTIEELAKCCNVSKTSIIRFTKKLSLSGFSELKVYLKLEKDKPAFETKEEDYLNQLCLNYSESAQSLRNANMDSAFEYIYNAKRVFIFGSGSIQLNAAKEIYRLFFKGGEYFHYFDSKYDIEDAMYNLTESDVMMIISLNGESDTVIDLAKKLKLKNIPTISVTQSKNNTLATLSTESLYFSSHSYRLPGNGCTVGLLSSLFIFTEIFYIKYQIYKNKKMESEK